jgi:hypothetical protein
MRIIVRFMVAIRESIIGEEDSLPTGSVVQERVGGTISSDGSGIDTFSLEQRVDLAKDLRDRVEIANQDLPERTRRRIFLDALAALVALLRTPRAVEIITNDSRTRTSKLIGDPVGE